MEKTIRTWWGELRKGERKSKRCLPTTMVHSVRNAKLIVELVRVASFSASPGGHQDHQPPVSHPTQHQSHLAVSPSEMIPGTVTRVTHDCSDLAPLCPGKALDEPGAHSCRWNPLRSVINCSLLGVTSQSSALKGRGPEILRCDQEEASRGSRRLCGLSRTGAQVLVPPLRVLDAGLGSA